MPCKDNKLFQGFIQFSNTGFALSYYNVRGLTITLGVLINRATHFVSTSKG